ncbi:hypothetical protein LTR78_001802 [Recurvomyces mirabilis]|uniref:RTA1-domain-containing protein n=1 Tax=Recurvomyces mirabilis TaxID=574656 RepID=A0AAE0WVU9_9PEZI|nr:hypothetical protein LTR78_001802 [Recurvomyces mirabilis]KAK5156758.1 hypothetical protein LTS14_004971 [Recurvomyces mirabilis]
MLSLRDSADSASGDNALSAFKFYYYHPSLPAAIIFIILFGLATLAHGVQMVRARTWFMVPFVIGGTFETIGYIGRALSAGQNPGPYTLGPYIIQSLVILVAPALFAASIYMQLGRVVLLMQGEHALFIHRTWLTKIFVGGDVLSFLMQSSGAGLMASGNGDSINTGKTIVVAGLLTQVVFFGLFVLAAALFHVRMEKVPTRKSLEVPWWRRHMLGLYLVSILIFVRSTVRVVEYVQGFDGFIMTHEVFLYVFDAAMMWVTVGVMSFVHPGEVARELRQGKAVRVGVGFEEVKDGVDMGRIGA